MFEKLGRVYLLHYLSILFIIFIADLFFIKNDIDFTSYADDTTPCVCGQNFSEVIDFLESNAFNVFKRFHENGLMANSRGKSLGINF